MPTPLEIFQDKEKFIDKSIRGLESEVAVIQREMLGMILDDYLPKFTLDKDGNIANTSSNILRAAALDKVIDEWNIQFQQSVLKGYTKRVLELSGFNKEYFNALDPSFKKQVLKNIPDLENKVNAILGIKKVVVDDKITTKLVRGGFLDTLQAAEPIKQELKAYVIDSVNSNVGFKQYEQGFKALLQKDNGVVDRYYKTYVHDTFSQIDRVESSFHAERLGLTHFIYQGSLIKTSRPFCCKRAGKVFSVNDVDSWKCDINLLGKPTGKACDDSYRPLIELGKYNCRHSLRYISDSLAERMGVTESRTIIKRQGSSDCIGGTKDAKKEDQDTFVPAKSIEEAEKNQAEWIKTLSDEEKKVVFRYTEGYYGEINEVLRGGGKLSALDSEQTILLNNILKKAPKFQGESFRGLALEKWEYDSFMKNVKKNGILSDSGFMSTSFVERTGRSFTMPSSDMNKVFFKIKGNNGVLINKLSDIPEENEILFNMGSKFKIEKLVTTFDQSLKVNITEINLIEL